MDEESRWDPEVRRYFRKIIWSFFFGLLWMITCATTGIYYKLGYTGNKPVIQTILFYAAMALTLGLLLWYLYNTWKKKEG